MILKNKGMYLETIVNNSLKKICPEVGFIYKMPINHNLISVNENIITAKINKNYFCDYVGLWKGNYVEFEAKECEKDYFNLSNIKEHQLKKLKLVKNNNGLSFVIIYFHIYEKLFLLTISEIDQLKTKKIPFDFFCQNCFEIDNNGIECDINNLFNHLVNYKM